MIISNQTIGSLAERARENERERERASARFVSLHAAELAVIPKDTVN